VPPAFALLNYKTVRELYVIHFRGFFPPYRIFLYFISFARRISEAAVAGRGARSAPFCVIKEPKKICVRTCGKNPLVLNRRIPDI
jgi:hypothetical protein